MRLVYDAEVDILSVLLSDAPVVESDHTKSGIILDFDATGHLVGLEILQASTRMANPLAVEYSLVPSVAPSVPVAALHH